LEGTEIQNVDDDVAMEILGELPQTAPRGHNPRAIATIEPAEWDDASRITEVFEGFRDVMAVIESDQFGTNADIWRGYLWLPRRNARNPDDQITQAWADAQKIWEHWESRYPTVPTQHQRETVIRSLQKPLRSVHESSSPKARCCNENYVSFSSCHRSLCFSPPHCCARQIWHNCGTWSTMMLNGP
jgi:hypothetical protein